jgi:hypothetical protein
MLSLTTTEECHVSGFEIFLTWYLQLLVYSSSRENAGDPYRTQHEDQIRSKTNPAKEDRVGSRRE